MPTSITDLSPTKRKEELTFHEVKHHADIGFHETERRSTGEGRVGAISFNEADELFRSYIDENNWPYDALLFDPRIFTFIFEKTSRLLANKPRGRLVPREGSDVLAAKINNTLLDYQWDQATRGGSMLQKWALMDINARKYGASFALCNWRYETSPEGKVLFDGPEMTVLNNRDFAHDLPATAIENANWVQARQYVTFQELERVNDHARTRPIYKNMDALRDAIGRETVAGGGGDARGSNWQSRNRAISHLELDPVGKDMVFKSVEIVTEYRRDRWITFAPKHGIILRDIPNPYSNNEIPVTMLKYYIIDDDLYGLSEIEPIKGLQKAINALLCQYVDEINQNLYSPIAIGPGVRQHTLEWGKGARWIMNNPMTDFRLVESRSNAAQYFNNTYSVLVSAMMNALGESSLGVSNVEPAQRDKTATEVKALQLQRNARDNYNQMLLAESIKRQMMLWHSMDQQLLFSDPKKQNYIIRVAGRDAIKYFSERGLSEYDMSEEAMAVLREQAEVLGMSLNEMQAEGIDITQMQSPRFPVRVGEGKEEKVVPKLRMDETGEGGELTVVPDDIKGTFDFSVDVESMSVGADEERRQARQTAVNLLVSNPNVLMMFQQEGIRPKFKDLFVTWLDDLGFKDAEKYFESAQGQTGPTGQPVPVPPSGGGGDQGQMLKQMMESLGGGGQPEKPAEPTINPPNPEQYQQLINGPVA